VNFSIEWILIPAGVEFVLSLYNQQVTLQINNRRMKTSSYTFIIIVLISLSFTACTTKDEELRTWIDIERKGTKFGEEDLNFLTEKYGEPTSISSRGDDKEYGYRGMVSFYLSDFTKDEAEGFIREDSIRYSNLVNWLEVTGAEQGLPSYSRVTSQNYNWEEFKQKRYIDDEDYFKSIYVTKVGDRKVSFNDLVNGFNEKYPELSHSQSVDSISKKYRFSDYEKQVYTSTVYTFKTADDIWYSSVYDLRDYDGASQKDFLINQFRDLVVNREKIITPILEDDGSYCISDKGKQKLLEHLYGTWIHKSIYGEGTIVLGKDGQFSLQNRLASNSGRWTINCSGEISTPNTNLQISDSGVLAGETLYKKQ
jgi:hypothetical protein